MGCDTVEISKAFEKKRNIINDDTMFRYRYNIESRAKYYEVLDYAHTTMDYQPFLEFVAKLVVESEQLWLSVLG